MTRSTFKTTALLFSGMTLFGSATPLSKLIVGHFPVFSASLLRVLVGALVVLPFLGGRLGTIRSLERRDWVTVVAIAAIGIFGFTALLLYGMRLVSGVVGAIIMSAAPAVTATGAVLFLSDQWNRGKAAAIALAVTGIVTVNVGGHTPGASAEPGSGTGTLIMGSLLVFGAVCCEALYTLIGKAATKRLDPMLTVFLASVLAVPLFVAAALAIETGSFDAAKVTLSGWLYMLAWGAGTLGLGSVLWYEGLKRAEGTVAAGFMGVMPVSALIFSYVLLSEPVRAVHIVGFAIVFAGVVIVSREHKRDDAGDH